ATPRCIWMGQASTLIPLGLLALQAVWLERMIRKSEAIRVQEVRIGTPRLSLRMSRFSIARCCRVRLLRSRLLPARLRVAFKASGHSWAALRKPTAAGKEI